MKPSNKKYRTIQRWLVAPTIMVSLFIQLSIQSHAYEDPTPAFTMSPTKILTGRTRDVTITVDKGDLSQYAPQRPPVTTGVTFELVGDKLFTLANENKSMIIRMKVDADADTGIIKIIISKNDGTDVHSFDLEISKKIDSGPTPGDMEEVDAMCSHTS